MRPHKSQEKTMATITNQYYAAQERADDAQQSTAVSDAEKKRLPFRLLVVGIVLLVLTLFLEFEDLPVFGAFGFDDETVSLFA
jgi:cytochrome c-type biogenesis protein CcmH/NrfG